MHPDDETPTEDDIFRDERICDECGDNDVDVHETRDGRFVCDLCLADEPMPEDA